ncbi:MAG TPA: DUF3999 family protein [Blastocatellia bacterium]|nr:DUF3999 family protein [Blastocatellia bacterium]
MKKINAALLVIGLLASTTYSFADDAMSSWQSYAGVSRPTARPEGLCRLTLSPQVLEQARTDLADLRLVDGAGREVPYALRIRREFDTSSRIQTKELNRGQAAGGISELTVDLGENPEAHNQAVIETAGRNFRRTVELDGSDDARAWRVLQTGALLFSFESDNKTAESNKVGYPTSRYRYLRARVSGDSLVDKSAPAINSISVMMSHRETGENVTQNLSIPYAQPTRTEGGPGSSLLLDLGNRVPCDRLSLDITDQAFSRPFSLEIADDPQNPILVISGDLRRRAGDERKPIVVVFDEVSARKLRLTITDFANPALGINSISASAPARQLFFETSSAVASPLSLYVGNPNAEAPRYDFETRLSWPLAAEPPKCEMDEMISNPTFRPEPKPLTERVPWLIYVVLGVSSLALASILVSLVRSARVVKAG